MTVAEPEPRYSLDDFNEIPSFSEHPLPPSELLPLSGNGDEDPWGEKPRMRIVSLADFTAVDEPSAEPLIGSDDDTLLPANGSLLMYGDGGAGKTTLTVDGIAHFAAGAEWLGFPQPRPLRVLLIENEGPRGKFRRRLKAKISSWQGEDFAHNIDVLEEPWTQFTFSNPDHRAHIALHMGERQTDVLVVGPLASVGTIGGGTPDEISAFSRLIDNTRERCERPFAVWIVHHENKAGDVSGAWERYPDTLVHVSAQGNGFTRVWWRKVRWSSTYHNTTQHLTWADGDTFDIDEQKARDLHAELEEAFTNDDEWRTAKESAGLINANIDAVREALSDLTDRHVFQYELGPKGRHGSAKCWRLKGDSDPLSHPESPTTLDGFDEKVTRVTPPVRGVTTRESPTEPAEGDSADPSDLDDTDLPWWQR